MTESLHDLPSGRALLGEERPGGMTQIMRMEIRHADRVPGAPEAVVPVDRCDRSALRSGEDVAVGTGLGVRVEVMRQLVDQEGRQRRPAGRVVLRRGRDEAVVALLLLDLSSDPRMEQVDVTTAVGAELALSGAGSEGDEEDERSIPRLDRFGELEHGVVVDQGPLGTALHAGALDVARIDREVTIADRGIENRPQESVGLRGLKRRHLVGELGVPPSHLRWLDGRQPGLAERRLDVPAVQVGVERLRRGGERSTVWPAAGRQPLDAELTEALRRPADVDDHSPKLVSLD